MDEIPAPIAAVLDAERETLNHRFRLRQATGSRIDATAFLDHMRNEIVPLVVRTSEKFPERVRNVIAGLYDVSLDLFAASYLGPEAKLTWVARAWREILPLLPVLLARESQRVAGSVCNAIVRVAEQPGARAEDWLRLMTRVAPHCSSVHDLLLAGRVAAWLAGMAQYRAAALSAARELPCAISAAACGLAKSPDETTWREAIERLAHDRWLTIASALQPSNSAAIAQVGVVGAFRGFGGPFLHPPVVQTHQDTLYARDATGVWQLTADAFGTYFCRAGDIALSKQKPSAVRIDAQGTIFWDSLRLTVPYLSKPTSFAFDGDTLAVTIATSHHIFLFAPSGSAT